MDSLGLERFGVMCWSGGGPSTYRLAVKHPDRVTSVYLGLLAHALDRYDDSDRWFTEALACHERMEAPYFVALT